MKLLFFHETESNTRRASEPRSSLKRSALFAERPSTKQKAFAAQQSMKALSAFLCLTASSIALGACPNQCSGHGMQACWTFGKFANRGAFSQATARRMMPVYATKLAAKSQEKSLLTLEPIVAKVRRCNGMLSACSKTRCFTETCPSGPGWSTLSDANGLDTQVIFKGAEPTSKNLLTVFVDPQSNAMNKGLQVVVNALSSGAGVDTGYFQYKVLDEKSSSKTRTSHPIRISDHASLGTAMHLKQRNLPTGIFVFWDASKEPGATLVSNVRRGDEYAFTTQSSFFSLYNEGDSNSAHRAAQCSGRGSCDFTRGLCSCSAGFEGSACQRSE
mgnify:CR=1 FL=1